MLPFASVRLSNAPFFLDIAGLAEELLAGVLLLTPFPALIRTMLHL
jgi:hypothetical protein